jgi:hypothetical protein
LTDEEIRHFRTSALLATPRFGLDLLVGLMQDPVPAAGRDLVLSHLPAQTLEKYPTLLRRYLALKTSLLA